MPARPNRPEIEPLLGGTEALHLLHAGVEVLDGAAEELVLELERIDALGVDGPECNWFAHRGPLPLRQARLVRLRARRALAAGRRDLIAMEGKRAGTWNGRRVDSVREKTVLVVGVSGLIGHAAAAQFAVEPGWKVLGVSRRVPTDLPGVALRSVDLLDRASSLAEIGAMADGHASSSTPRSMRYRDSWRVGSTSGRSCATRPCCATSSTGWKRPGQTLEHITLLQGSKAYGVHSSDPAVSDARLPLRERDPLRPHANFYFVQEEFLAERRRRAGWAVTILRPTVVYGGALGTNMNLLPVIGAYAALLRQEGKPLHFPKEWGVPSLAEAVDGDLLARAIVLVRHIAVGAPRSVQRDERRRLLVAQRVAVDRRRIRDGGR